MKFLVDNQLPTALARFLASRGVECRHVLDINVGVATDASIWDYASRNDFVVVSKDEDFLYMANVPRQKRGSSGCESATAAPRLFSQR